MARVTHTPTQLAGPYPSDGVNVTLTAANATDKEEFVHTGKEIIIARNTGAGARTVTITSVAHPVDGRTGDVTADSLAAGEVHVYGPFAIDGWRQTNGKLYFEASHAEVIFSVLRLP